jgi:hypothetical protein
MKLHDRTSAPQPHATPVWSLTLPGWAQRPPALRPAAPSHRLSSGLRSLWRRPRRASRNPAR